MCWLNLFTRLHALYVFTFLLLYCYRVDNTCCRNNLHNFPHYCDKSHAYRGVTAVYALPHLILAVASVLLAVTVRPLFEVNLQVISSDITVTNSGFVVFIHCVSMLPVLSYCVCV